MDLSLNIDNSLQNNDSLLMNRIGNLESIANGELNFEELTDEQKTRAAEAARGFESMFFHMMLKEMKSAMLDEFKDDKTDTFGAETLEGFTDLALSDHMARSGRGIGIAEMVYSQLTGGRQLEPITIEKQDSVSPVALQDMISKAVSDESEDAAQTVNDALKTNFGGTFLERVENRLEQYSDIIKLAAEKFGVSQALIKSIITAESAGRNTAKSGAGAKGLMQLMDGAAKDMGVNNSFDPEENIMGGSKYIGKMLDMFDDNLELALAGYNAGPGNVRKYDGVPPFNETKNYISKVKDYLEYFSGNSD